MEVGWGWVGAAAQSDREGTVCVCWRGVGMGFG